MHRFYCREANLNSKDIVITDKDELHHLRNVLRLKKNTEICLFDGKGREAHGKLLAVKSKQADVQILRVKQFHHKKPLIILACALPKKSKFDLIVEKATELGVDEIIPLKTRRTEINLKKTFLDKRNLRYQTVAVNAAKQSQRAFLPKIHPITDFTTALTHLAQTTDTIIPSLSGSRQGLLKTLEELKSPGAVSFFIGPEGDFTSDEYSQAQASGAIPVTLGETILKVETAAICTLSCANLLFRAPTPGTG